MEKEEILAKSRKENRNMDEREASAAAAAGKLAAQIGMLVCCVIAVLEVTVTGHLSYASWMIYFSILGTMFIVKYIKLKERHELWVGILYCVLFVMFTVLFVTHLLG